VNFTVTALILALLVTFSCNFPLSMADELFEERCVVPSWSSPLKNIVGSAKMK
jgi:hypothetical protein